MDHFVDAVLIFGECEEVDVTGLVGDNAQRSGPDRPVPERTARGRRSWVASPGWSRTSDRCSCWCRRRTRRYGRAPTTPQPGIPGCARRGSPVGSVRIRWFPASRVRVVEQVQDIAGNAAGGASTRPGPQLVRVRTSGSSGVPIGGSQTVRTGPIASSRPVFSGPLVVQAVVVKPEREYVVPPGPHEIRLGAAAIEPKRDCHDAALAAPRQRDVAHVVVGGQHDRVDPVGAGGDSALPAEAIECKAGQSG